MRNSFYKVGGSALLLGALLACGAPEEAVAGGADVGVNINIGPPPIMVAKPPAMVLVPNTQVYYAPGAEFDIFFSNGYWWSPRGDRWYRARAYNGPWRNIDRRYVPRPVSRVPHDYRHIYARERHIPYREWLEHQAGGEHHAGYKRHGGGERHAGYEHHGGGKH